MSFEKRYPKIRPSSWVLGIWYLILFLETHNQNLAKFCSSKKNKRLSPNLRHKIRTNQKNKRTKKAFFISVKNPLNFRVNKLPNLYKFNQISSLEGFHHSYWHKPVFPKHSPLDLQTPSSRSRTRVARCTYLAQWCVMSQPRQVVGPWKMLGRGSFFRIFFCKYVRRACLLWFKSKLNLKESKKKKRGGGHDLRRALWTHVLEQTYGRHRRGHYVHGNPYLKPSFCWQIDPR